LILLAVREEFLDHLFPVGLPQESMKLLSSEIKILKDI